MSSDLQNEQDGCRDCPFSTKWFGFWSQRYHLIEYATTLVLIVATVCCMLLTPVHINDVPGAAPGVTLANLRQWNEFIAYPYSYNAVPFGYGMSL
jgi:hypothetical protein